MKSVNQFISSFDIDKRLAEADIVGSIAHTKMLCKSKIISKSDAKKIILGLEAILDDLHNGWKLPVDEDIHYAIEKELINRIGSVGGKMHTARSRNDQVTTDLRLYLKKELKNIKNKITHFQNTLINKAIENIDVIMPGFTHLQHAQPILASHYILAYAWMMQRDKERFVDCYKRIDVLPLGSAALAGTSFNIDRHYTARLLHFKNISNNSLDAVSDRDFVIEFIFCIVVMFIHLTRLCEEIILWINPEFCYITIDSKFTSGSSIMPQKRNPDYAEVIRGRFGRVLGNLISIITVMKALPLAYNRDLQEDKACLFDALDNTTDCLCIIDDMFRSIKFIKRKTLQSTEKGFILATEIADYLSLHNVPFRQAHGIVQNIVLYCQQTSKDFNNLSLQEYKKFSQVFEQDIFNYLNIDKIVNMKNSYGGTSKISVLHQIDILKQKLQYEK
ncbi:MAG: argininosuccinate lyase [Endomicrobium sp.]|jgi:argininosuccinate lyase|nr:argininosuccinate lyase [Endomicrobium sp.]